MMDKKHCVGCRDDFYNYNKMGLNETPDGPSCWSRETATLVEALDISIDLPPPYTALPLTLRPSCYRRPRYVRVKPASLTSTGFWK